MKGAKRLGTRADDEGGERVADRIAYLEIDISNCKALMDHIQDTLGQEKMGRIMMRTLNEAGKRTRTILKEEIPKEYEAKPRWIQSTIGSARIGKHGNITGCTIPIDGTRGTIGKAGRFSTYGRTDRVPKGKMRKLRAKLVTGKISELPQKMNNQGGNPPFVAKGLVFTRKTDKPKPIVRVVDRGIPQMPLHRSKEDVQGRIADYTQERLAHHFRRMIEGKW